MSDDAAPQKKRPMGLGRGLSALLGEIQEAPVSTEGTQAGPLPAGLKMVAVANMRPLPNQPRKSFDEAALEELADSIRTRGLLQPIVVRDMGGVFEIVAGERRWRAAQKAQLHQVPVIVKEFDDRTALEIAIIENIQREQLNAWEEGEGYRRLIDDHGYTQDQLSKIVGKSRSHVANLIRLRNLPLPVLGWLTAGDLTMGHARALLGSDDPEGLARRIIDKGLSVRDTERLARKGMAPRSAPTPRMPPAADADIQALERQLSDLIGVKVAINHQGKQGSITLAYSSLEQLDMICQRLSGERI